MKKEGERGVSDGVGVAVCATEDKRGEEEGGEGKRGVTHGFGCV